MPVLSIEHVEHLLRVAQLHRRCGECGHSTAMEYCRTCDEFFWHHLPGCAMYKPKHDGHRLYLVPFVEVRQ